MPDILIQDGGFKQATGAPTVVYDQLVESGYQASSQACLVDLTPPTFGGITSLTMLSRGQLRAAWSAGSDISTPVRYEVYVKAHNTTALFTSINLIAVTDKLLFDIFETPDGEFLQAGVAYHVGVKAIDAVGNRDSNVATLSVTSTGLGLMADSYKTDGAFVVNASNQLQGTLWVTRNGQLDPTVVLGLASYQVYDKAGAAVPGLGASGISADVNGQFKITPVASTLSESLEHYMVKVTVRANGADRTGYVPLIQKAPDYDISGLFFVNQSKEFDGTFWISADEKIRTTGLGTGSYQVFDYQGAPVVGMSESGITADSNGIYKLTHIASLLADEYAGYSVRVAITIDGVVRSEMFSLNSRDLDYQVKAVFSINALNQLQATFWAAFDGKIATSALGAANYTVYDADGAAVSGLSQSGITADVNGRYKITPVAATLLTDLTHYTVKIGIVISGIERVAYRGFTLLGN